MAQRTASSVLILATFALGACKDKAEPDYAKCVQADTAGDIQGAWTACNAAVADDPNSKSGKAAAAKLAEMKPKYDAWKASQPDAEDQAVLDRMAAQADRQRAKAAQRAAQAQAGLVAAQAVCGSIQHDPALAAMFSIASSTASDDRTCDITVQANVPITQNLFFNWIFYDKDGVKLGVTPAHIGGLGVGDKQRLSIHNGDNGTMAKIVSKPK